MKTLILTRHAKSSWSDLSLSDHERPLNKRGRKAATAIGLWLHDRGLYPDAVLSSTAERCRETWARLSVDWPSAPEPDFQKRLYLPAAETMYQAIKPMSGDVLMMLGHNPGISMFARHLLATAPTHPKFDQYPTAATTIITFDIDTWSDPFQGIGVAADFIVPRDLTE